MSIVTELKYTANLDKGVCMTPITPSFMGGDQEAHRITVDCYRQNSREPVDLSDAGVTAYFVRADGMTIPLAGETNGSKASVLLPAACYAVMGRFSLVVKLSLDDGTADSISTVFWGEGAVSRSRTDVVIDPDSVIPSLEDLLAQIAAMEIATNNANTAAENANQAAADALKNVDDAVARQDKTISQLSEEIAGIQSDYYDDEYHDITGELTITTGEYIVAKEESHYRDGTVDPWEPSAHTNLIPVAEGEKIKISTKTNTNCPCVVFMRGSDFSNGNYVGYAGELNVVLTDEVITIPDGVSYVGFNTADYANYPIKVAKTQKKAKIIEVGDSIDAMNTENFFAERRIKNLEKGNEFVWKQADNKYFVCVVDDTSAFLEPCYNLFHSKNIPLSSATILDYVEKTWDGTTHSVKELLDLIVQDGGEVLMHYKGSLYATDEDAIWRKKLVTDMLTLRGYGYDVNGLICAGSSDVNTEIGQSICQKYYLYSDVMGITPQYNMGTRKMLIGVNSIDEFKAWVDECMQENGVYPICIHGNRASEGDESLATVDNLSQIIDYIASVGGVCTTYKAIYDAFASSIAQENAAFVDMYRLNKLQTDMLTTGQNGIVCKNNGDGTYALNGTSAQNTVLRIGKSFVLKKGKYVLSNAMYNSNVVIALSTRNYGSGEVCGVYTGPATLNIADDTTLYPSVNIASGITLDNYIIAPMLEEGSKPHPFVRYGEPFDILAYIDAAVVN